MFILDYVVFDVGNIFRNNGVCLGKLGKLKGCDI